MNLEINEEGLKHIMQDAVSVVTQEYQETADKTFAARDDVSISDIVAEFSRTAKKLGAEPEISAFKEWAQIIKSGKCHVSRHRSGVLAHFVLFLRWYVSRHRSVFVCDGGCW